MQHGYLGAKGTEGRLKGTFNAKTCD